MTQITAPWLQDRGAQFVCSLLTNAGFQAWFVGGCVRNALLGAPVSDLDLATDASPQTVLDLAAAAGVRAIPTGFDHGTVTLVVDGAPFEITTFRRDVATDGRRAIVAFADNMTDDARRRDFTINALYAAPDGRVADPLGGMADLTAHRIRFIEDPAQRIKEDYLRILRFFRFYAWYGNPNNGPDRDGLAACAAHIDGLQSLSVERITAEVLKFLSAPDPAPAMAAFASTGGLSQILPGADAGALAVLVHLEGLSGAAPDPVRRLAVLGGNADAGLRLSKGQLRHLAVMKQPDPPVTLAYRYGYDAGRDALLVMAAVTGQPVSPQALSSVLHAAKQKFPLTAKDLMPELSGAALGKALTKAEKRWIDSGFRLTKAELLD